MKTAIKIVCTSVKSRHYLSDKISDLSSYESDWFQMCLKAWQALSPLACPQLRIYQEIAYFVLLLRHTILILSF